MPRAIAQSTNIDLAGDVGYDGLALFLQGQPDQVYSVNPWNRRVVFYVGTDRKDCDWLPRHDGKTIEAEAEGDTREETID